jgi:hypothetical protein
VYSRPWRYVASELATIFQVSTMPHSRPSVRRGARGARRAGSGQLDHAVGGPRGALLTELGVRRCPGAVLCIFRGQRHPGRLARSRSVSLELKRMAWAPDESLAASVPHSHPLVLARSLCLPSFSRIVFMSTVTVRTACFLQKGAIFRFTGASFISMEKYLEHITFSIVLCEAHN